jgi:hypothetical protein
MDTCSVETGLLRKKPCGHAAVARCLNCERALCAQHAVPEVSGAGKRSGKFICQECKVALQEHEKRLAKVEHKPGAAKPAAAPPAAAPKAPAAPAAPAAAPEKKDSGGGLDFK